MDNDVKKVTLLRRTIYFTNPRFQLSFLSYVLAMVFTVIAIFYASNMYFFFKFAAKGKEIGLPPQHVFFKFLHEQQHSMDIIFLISALFCFLLVICIGFFISNRVAGSMYRMEDHLRKMTTKGDYVDLKFRRSDYFHELADSLNAFVRSIKK
jgi:hypothetical protein